MIPAVVIPAYQAAPYLDRCLTAVLEAGFNRSEITVVDDGSSDGTDKLIKKYDVRCIRHSAPLGAAAARNAGAANCDADVIVFIDADVAVHKDARRRILDAFSRDSSLLALFGSYDDQPAAPALVSRYRNLLHHHVHQSSPGYVRSFWTGLGAVRRDTFAALSGFNSDCTMMEDIEFGLRLPDLSTRLFPDIQGTHLKAWTMCSMFRSDLFDRAIPWARLLYSDLSSDRAALGQLNLSHGHRLSAACVGLTLLSLLIGVFQPIFLGLTAVFFMGYVFANLSFWRLLFRTGGPRLLVASLGFHMLHYSAALIGFLWVRIVECNRFKK